MPIFAHLAKHVHRKIPICKYCNKYGKNLPLHHKNRELIMT